MNIFKYGLIALLAAGLASCGGGSAPTTVAVTGNNALTNGSAAATYTATFTPSSTTGTVEWALNPPAPNGGTLSAASSPVSGGIATVQYTPPVSVAAAIQVTLTATKQGSSPVITNTKTITVNPTITTGVPINGKIFKWNNKPFGGVNIFITDSTGTNLPDTQSADNGTFTVSGVVPPYTISAVPSSGTDVTPLSFDKVTTTTPNLVLTKAQYLGGLLPGFNPTPAGQNEDCAPVLNDAKLSVQLTNSVNNVVGARADVIFIGEGIDFRPTDSWAFSQIPANNNIIDIPVKFSQEFCKDKIEGKLVVLEYDASGTIIKKGTRDVTVRPGNPTCVGLCDAYTIGGANTPTLNTNAVSGISFTGNVQFPQGSDDTTSNVKAYIRYQKAPGDVPAYYPLVKDTVTKVDPNYNTGVVDLSAEGLQYRLQAEVKDTSAKALSWVNSAILNTAQTGIVLAYPSFGDTITPFGNTADGDVTPEFKQGTVSQMNTYFRFFRTAANQELWLGGSPLTSMTLPVLPAPARLTLQKPYIWQAINALKLTDVTASLNGSDVTLGATASGGVARPYNALRNLYGKNTQSELDLIISGSFNGKDTTACVITSGQNCP